MADIIILTGPPGAGKSTTARALAARYEPAVHLHTDDFWGNIAAGAIPPYLPESEAQNRTVMRVIRAAACAYAQGGFVTVIDGVIGPWMLEHFRGAAEEGVGRLHYLVLRPDRVETLRRARGRSAPDALVDVEPIESMWDQFADLGTLESHVIETTGQQTSETLSAVAEAVTSGRFVLDEGSG